MDASSLQLIILPAGLIAVAFAIYLARDVLARERFRERRYEGPLVRAHDVRER